MTLLEQANQGHLTEEVNAFFEYNPPCFHLSPSLLKIVDIVCVKRSEESSSDDEFLEAIDEMNNHVLPALGSESRV
jgi:hypothetical protein